VKPPSWAISLTELNTGCPQSRCARDDALLRDRHHAGDGQKLAGIGSQYATATTDSGGNPLDGSKTYKIHLPPNVPAKQFWSLVPYDNQTRSMLQTDQRLPGIGSQKKDIVINPDTSVDMWFGPTAPAGHEANWVQTVPGKAWNVLLRLYSPLQPWFDKTWKPDEFELVK
jgi:hypothetical protein